MESGPGRASPSRAALTRRARRTLPLLAAAWLAAGAAPAVHASPVLQGSVKAGSDYFAFCSEQAECEAFAAAGCPDSMAAPDGLTLSVARVGRDLWGKPLTFTFSSLDTAASDAAAPITGAAAPAVGGMSFSFLVDCDALKPPWGFFGLSGQPGFRSFRTEIPEGTRWVLAWSYPGTTDAHWSAQ